jgi:uncharacterized protein (DUF2147 family)
MYYSGATFVKGSKPSFLIPEIFEMRIYSRIFAAFCMALPMLALPATSHARSGANPSPAITTSPPASLSSATPDGLWMTANHDAIIQIAPCGSGLCGYIVGMFLGPQDPTPKDWAGTSQCRLNIIQAAPQTDSSGWPYWTGSIVNPRDGTAYHAIIRLNAQNQLLLRGYVVLPIFGETQTWTPYHGTLAENCRLPQPIG